MTWAANHDASLEALDRVQRSLTVELMMVPRSAFVICKPNETAAQIKNRNSERFSYFPVVDGKDRVIGLYNAERWFSDEAPTVPVSDDFAPLSEDILIGADASIFDFVRQTDTCPTRLVVSGNQIAGLVSMSDLQKLPVRASLFAMVTSLEMAMALTIVLKWPEPKDWMSLLSDDRRADLLETIDKAKGANGFVSDIALTQLSDKATIIRKGKLLNGSSDKLKKRFNDIRDLRDNLAHANHYAATSDAAKDVCQVVKSIHDTKAELLKLMDSGGK